MRDIAYSLARVAVPILFIVSGIGKFMNVAGIANHPAMKDFVNFFGGIPSPIVLGYLVASIEVSAGLLLLIGFKTRWAALALFIFTGYTILFVHNFWMMEGVMRAAQQSQALKNLAIMGALLLLAVVGAGRYSVDERMGTKT
jgi:putative oxidoreductase